MIFSEEAWRMAELILRTSVQAPELTTEQFKDAVGYVLELLTECDEGLKRSGL